MTPFKPSMQDKNPELLTPKSTSAAAAEVHWLRGRRPQLSSVKPFPGSRLPIHAKAKRLSKFEVPHCAANLTKTDRQLTNDSNHGYRAHVRRMRK